MGAQMISKMRISLVLALAGFVIAGCEECTTSPDVNVGVGIGSGGASGGVSVGRSCGSGYISLGLGNSWHLGI